MEHFLLCQTDPVRFTSLLHALPLLFSLFHPNTFEIHHGHHFFLSLLRRILSGNPNDDLTLRDVSANDMRHQSSRVLAAAFSVKGLLLRLSNAPTFVFLIHRHRSRTPD
jgi:hypothetical protein